MCLKYRWHIVPNYRGPTRQIFCRGPNWWQVTLSVGGWRLAVIRAWHFHYTPTGTA